MSHTINHLEIDLSNRPIKIFINDERIPLTNIQSIDIHLSVDDEYTVTVDKSEKYFMGFLETKGVTS